MADSYVADGENTSEIGTRVRAARERIGFSREALAFHSGISWSAIAQVEAGRRTNLRPRTLAALADALGVTIDYLVSGHATSGAMFEHRALLYDSDRDFVDTAASFLSEATDRSEAALAVTSRANIDRLRRRLGSDASRVKLADHVGWYSTPAAALDGYRAFMNGSLDQGAPWVRIIGEPVWADRSEAEVRLWARYESLLNIVFTCAPVTLLCPYDTRQLDAKVIEHARATHPHTLEHQAILASEDYADPGTFVLEP